MKEKIFFIISFVLFGFFQTLNFSLFFQVMTIISVGLMVFSGAMVYSKYNARRSEVMVFVISYSLHALYILYILIFGFYTSFMVEVCMFIIAFMNLFFLFRVLSLGVSVSKN